MDLDVVAGDTELLWNIENKFLQSMPVGDPVHERYDDVQTCIKSAVIFTETFNDE